MLFRYAAGLGMLLMVVCSCHDTLKVIKGCCQDPPAYGSLGDGKIWVPNVFTPNGDGIHDRLIIYGDSVKQIETIVIKNSDGMVVFNNAHLPANDYDTAWDGEFNDRIEQGMYSFTIKAESITGYGWEIKGKVCICSCDPEIDKDLIPIRDCEFGLCSPPYPHCDHREFLECFEY